MPDPAPTSLPDLTARILAFREARDWAQFHGLKDEVLSLLSEAGELAQLFRWYEGEDLAAHVKSRKEDVADELADVLYWTLLLANDVGVDLAAAFERKMAKNEAKVFRQCRVGPCGQAHGPLNHERVSLTAEVHIGAALRRQLAPIYGGRLRRVDQPKA